MSTEPRRPAWMFWWPLPFWKVLAVLAATNVVMSLTLVALRVGLGVDLPGAAAGGAGGLTGYLIIMNLAMKARAAAKTNDGPGSAGTR